MNKFVKNIFLASQGGPFMYMALWNSYLKEYRSYAPALMPILEIGSRVKITLIVKWHVIIRHSKVHSHPKFEIPTSNDKRDMLQIKLF